MSLLPGLAQGYFGWWQICGAPGTNSRWLISNDNIGSDSRQMSGAVSAYAIALPGAPHENITARLSMNSNQTLIWDKLINIYIFRFLQRVSFFVLPAAI